MHKNTTEFDIVGFVTWHDSAGWHARYKGHLTDEARDKGCEEIVHAPTFEKIEIEAIVLRIAAEWYA